jgi:SAM-dependent methyltransferase
MRAGQMLIDMGCGNMPYRRLIEDAGIVYKGADIDGTVDLRIGSDGRIDLPNDSADAVLSVQVLEHVFDLDAYCGEIRRLLHADGTLFLSTHGTWLYHPHPEDHRRWTRTGLIGDLESRGFRVEEMKALVGPLATTTLLRLTGYAFVLRKLPVLGAFLASALSLFMNARAILEDAITPANMRFDNACVYWVRARPA